MDRLVALKWFGAFVVGMAALIFISYFIINAFDDDEPPAASDPDNINGQYVWKTVSSSNEPKIPHDISIHYNYTGNSYLLNIPKYKDTNGAFDKNADGTYTYRQIIFTRNGDCFEGSNITSSGFTLNHTICRK